MTPARRLRPAREEDVDALIELARRSWLSAFAQTVPFPLLAWWIAADPTTPRYREHWPSMTVLEEDGTILGLVQPIDAEINGLWVHPRHQGRGAGTTLLRAGEDAIRAAGHDVAWLTCSAYNENALAFYLRRGYVETRRDRSRHASGIELADVRMERARY